MLLTPVLSVGNDERGKLPLASVVAVSDPVRHALRLHGDVRQVCAGRASVTDTADHALTL